MTEEIEQLRAEIAKLKAVLRKYGAHQFGCDLRSGYGLCSCGLADAPATQGDSHAPKPRRTMLDGRKLPEKDT